MRVTPANELTNRGLIFFFKEMMVDVPWKTVEQHIFHNIFSFLLSSRGNQFEYGGTLSISYLNEC